MINLNLLKISKYGMMIFGTIVILSMAVLIFLMPNDESSIIWMIYVGPMAVVGKFGFWASVALWVLALVLNQKEE